MTTTQTTAKCLKCHRALTSAASIARGYGRTCATKVKAAAKAAITTTHKPHLVAKAEELIEQGAIVPIRGRRIFAVVSSDGTSTYKTAAQACSCPAGIKGRHVCYHRIAAQILIAA